MVVLPDLPKMIRGEGKVDIRLSEPYILIKMENKSNLSFSTPHLPLKKKFFFCPNLCERGCHNELFCVTSQFKA